MEDQGLTATRHLATRHSPDSADRLRRLGVLGRQRLLGLRRRRGATALHLAEGRGQVAHGGHDVEGTRPGDAREAENTVWEKPVGQWGNLWVRSMCVRLLFDSLQVENTCG